MNTNIGMEKFEKDVIKVGKEGRDELIITFIKQQVIIFIITGNTCTSK